VKQQTIQALLEAALDQPSPTPALKKAIQEALEETNHSDRLLTRQARTARALILAGATGKKPTRIDWDKVERVSVRR